MGKAYRWRIARPAIIARDHPAERARSARAAAEAREATDREDDVDGQLEVLRDARQTHS